MKYGIIATFSDNSVKYVSSTRWGRPELTDDITNTALFVKEESAVQAIKTIRKDGFEPEGAELSVMEIDFRVERISDVPYPKKVAGFVLVIGEDISQPDARFYTGTKKPSEYPQMGRVGNVERATVFATEKLATGRLKSLTEEAEKNLARTINNVPKNYYMTESQRSAYHQSLIDGEQALLDMMKNLKAVKHEG